MEEAVEYAVENATSGNPNVGYIMLGLFLLALLVLLSGPKKKEANESERTRIAKLILSKKATPEEIAEKDGYDIDDIKKWVAEYSDLLVKYGLDAEERGIVDRHKDSELEWYADTCKKHIGDDWREKTKYDERELDKYKKK